MLNVLWLLMFVGAVVAGAATGRLDAVAQASIASCNQAVTLALGLVGAMVLWLGLVRVLHEAGLMRALARGLEPIFARLLPEVPRAHPALGMVVLNMASNVLGLGNAATPFGLAAMRQLNRLNRRPGVATDAMVVFLAINTSGLAVLPTGMVALRASLGSSAPGAIFLPTLLATLSAAVVGVVAARLLARLPRYRLAPLTASEAASLDGAEPAAGVAGGPEPEVDAVAATAAAKEGPSLLAPHRYQGWVAVGVAAVLVAALAYATWGLTTPAATAEVVSEASGALGASTGASAGVDSGLGAAGAGASWPQAIRHAVSDWSLLILMGAFVCVGLGRGVRVYDAVVEGGREGFDVALKILPYLVTILVGVGMLRASGAVDVLVGLLGPWTEWVGLPAEALPMALLRPLTGTGAYAIAADTMRAHGPDSLAGEVASTIMGTTETTFYVLALYLGTVGVRQARHALWTCLAADVAGTLVACWSCRLLLH